MATNEELKIMFKSDTSSPKAVKATNSCTGLIRTQAGVFGIMHSHKKWVDVPVHLTEYILAESVSSSCCGRLFEGAGCPSDLSLLSRTGYKEPNSETNMRVLGALTTYKDSYEIGAQLPSQVRVFDF